MSQPPQPPPPPPPQPPSDNPFSAPSAKEAKPVPQQPRETASALDGIVPTNPLAAISCYLGIFAMITCFGGVVLGPIAVVLGVLGLKSWKAQESQYGKTMSSIRAWIGIVTGTLAFFIGIFAIVMVILNPS